MTMAARLQSLWHLLVGREGEEPQAAETPVSTAARRSIVESFQIAPDDPIVPYFLGAASAVEVERLNLDSPAVTAMRAAGVKVVVPLVSHGELIGLLNLGSRLSQQDYSTDDRKLLDDLATQASPAVRVAQLVRQQQSAAQERERMDQELRIARLIQQTLLPKELPSVSGWQVAAHYQPAREVGGDFYDFLELPDGQLGLVVGDVTDKGIPAALVMATTRAILRSAAERLVSPSEVLQRVNDLLHPDIPPRMFVTCMYAVLNPQDGRLMYANAGHDLPYRRSSAGCDELRATGMPLGLMPGMTYEQKEIALLPGESVLFYSDGLTEAHNKQREMFGSPRLRELVGNHPGGAPLIDHLLSELSGFTGAGWHQEDDVMLVTLHRSAESELNPADGEGPASGGGGPPGEPARRSDSRTLAEFTLPSEPGNERQATERVAEAIRDIELSGSRLERLKTAVAEATMNAMEHGNEYRADLPVSIKVSTSPTAVSVQITDHGGGQPIPDAQSPDLEAKLAGEQTPRGWGLFLIKNMVDELRTSSDETHHTAELVMYLGGEEDGNEAS